MVLFIIAEFFYNVNDFFIFLSDIFNKIIECEELRWYDWRKKQNYGVNMLKKQKKLNIVLTNNDVDDIIYIIFLLILFYYCLDKKRVTTFMAFLF